MSRFARYIVENFESIYSRVIVGSTISGSITGLVAGNLATNKNDSIRDQIFTISGATMIGTGFGCLAGFMSPIVVPAVVASTATVAIRKYY